MTTTINTYFGDYLLGLFVTWTSEPTEGGGTSDITIDFTANMRSKLHVYGYTGVDVPDDNSAPAYAPDEETVWMDAANGKQDVFVTYDAADEYTTDTKFLADEA